MNTEMVLSEEWTKREIFQIKHTCVKLAQQFCQLRKRFYHFKKGEVWARSLCLKAVREVKEGYPVVLLFPTFNTNVLKTIENKRWHLDKDFDQSI
ncbi:MAG: hypothetical protein ACW964_17160 [Candidatus Hodarchaeales archaeon]|jgi:hypothetical protein